MRLPPLSLSLLLLATACDSSDDPESGEVGTDASQTAGTGQDETDPDGSTSGQTSSATTSANSTTGSDTSPATTTTSDASSGGPSETDDSSSGTTGSATTDDTSDGAECQDLETCCDGLGADLYGPCMTVVNMGSAGLCSQILSTYHNEGYCTGETYCLELGSCCDELPPGPGWAETCNYYADFGNQPQCAMLIGDYQLSGYCL